MTDNLYADQQFAAWARHCLGSRKRAAEYRRWALEAERAGRLDQYRRSRRNAEHSWADARFALSQCRFFKDAMNREN